MGLLSLIGWKPIALAIALLSAFLAGAGVTYQHEAKRYVALEQESAEYRAKVSAEAAAQADISRKQRLAQDRITRNNNEHALSELVALDAHYQSVLSGMRESAGSSGIVPRVPGATGSGSEDACFNVAAVNRRMDAALQKFASGTLGVLQRGDQALALAATCQAWLHDQLTLDSARSTPAAP